MIFGTFDLLHPGHLFVLEEATKLGSVTVIVARSKNVERMKGKKPSQSEQKRMEAIQTSFPFATVFLGDDTDFLAPVRAIHPDLILLGYDQRLPPGVSEDDLRPAIIRRLPAFRPERFKTSLIKKAKRGIIVR